MPAAIAACAAVLVFRPSGVEHDVVASSLTVEEGEFLTFFVLEDKVGEVRGGGGDDLLGVDFSCDSSVSIWVVVTKKRVHLR